MKNIKPLLVLVQKHKCIIMFVFVLLLLNTLLYSKYTSSKKPCYFKYPMSKRNHRSKKITILQWDKFWTEDSALEERTSPDGRCMWTNNRCALPMAHVVEFDYSDLNPTDLPWKFYR